LARRQTVSYLDGLQGHRPAQPAAPEELEDRTKAMLPL
jgi:hypothetical protein